MATQHQTPSSCRRRSVRRGRPRQGGFNFTEVLFAIMILGIGFIMVAAIFPVALQQTKLTGEEVVASTVARGGVNYVRQLGAVAGVLPVTDLNVADATATPPGPAAAAPIPPPAMLDPGQSRYETGKVLSFRDNRLDPITRDMLWRSIGGNFILPEDHRVGWIGMYRRGVTYTNTTAAAAAPGDAGVVAKPDPFAQVFIVGVQIRNRSVFEMAKDLRRFPDDDPPASATNSFFASLEPLPVFVKLTEGDLGIDTLTFFDGPGVGANEIGVAAAAEGAYVIISDDQLADDTSTTVVETDGQSNGRAYRLGSPRPDIGDGTWELAAGQDMAFTNPNNTPGDADDIHENIPARAVGDPYTGMPPAYAFVVGRGYTDPLDPAAGRDGLTQDAGFFVGFVPAN